MHFTTSQMKLSPVGVIPPMKLRSLVLDDCSDSWAVSALFVPALTELTIKRAEIDRTRLLLLVSLSYRDMFVMWVGKTVMCSQKVNMLTNRRLHCAQI